MLRNSLETTRRNSYKQPSNSVETAKKHFETIQKKWLRNSLETIL